MSEINSLLKQAHSYFLKKEYSQSEEILFTIKKMAPDEFSQNQFSKTLLYALLLGYFNQKNFLHAFSLAKKILQDYQSFTEFIPAVKYIICSIVISAPLEYYETLEYPVKLYIEPTNFCNLDCAMCNRRFMKRKVGYMDFELFKKIIDEVRFKETYYVDLYNIGESLFHPKIAEMVRYASSNLWVNIITNGTILTPKIFKALSEAGLKVLTISFEGSSKIRYEEMRKGASYEKVKENIDACLSLKNKDGFPKIGISYVDMNEPREDIEKFVQEYKDKVDEVIKIPFTYNRGLKRYDERGILRTVEPDVDKHNKVCPLPFFSLCIKWDGKVSLCCGDSDCISEIGDVNSDSISKIWNSEKLKKVRESILNKEYKNISACSDCSPFGRFID